jgi:nucleotide-binding universal stress UspA family protein
MDRVIAGYDGSPGSATALAWAAQQARLHHAELHVMTVVRIRTPVADVDDLRARLRPDIDHVTDGLPTEHHIEHGDTAGHLVHACQATDLLVVGSRRRHSLAERLLGSVSHACLHTAPCPVVVVREQPSRTHGVVLVGIDGSTAARHALTVAADEARLRGATLHAIHVVHWEHHGAEWITPTVRDLLGWGEHLLHKELAEAGVTAHSVVIHGHAADVLIRHSEDADLLVLGSRGHSPLANLAVGSTADHCARHARCPAMFVRASTTST